MGSSDIGSTGGFLEGTRVLEVGGELGEYCGKLLAGLGAEVIKVEPPEGERTRNYGPFYGDEPHTERSLYFWHYNFGKKSIVLDLDDETDRQTFRKLSESASLVLDARPKDYLADRGLGYHELAALNPSIVMSRISPFGDEGPWSDYKGSDLVHLALGGVMMNCGYDPEPSGFYETPPIAPQMWQSYHIAGEMAAMAILGALYHRLNTGEGQYLSTAVHQAVAQQTEGDFPSWIFLRQNHYRATCRHSRRVLDPPILAPTKDGRFLFPYLSYAQTDPRGAQLTIGVLAKHGMAEDLLEAKYQDPVYTKSKSVQLHIAAVIGRFVQRFKFDREIWREFQEVGQTWAPVRRPEENIDDEHWLSRETFLEVYRPEYDRTFTEVGAKWMCREVPWRSGPRSPLLGEHNDKVPELMKKMEADRRAPAQARAAAPQRPASASVFAGIKPRALEGLRFIDLGWMLASAGAGRFIAALGADVVKVEHKSRWDGLRFARGIVSPGGRRERDEASGPLPDVTPISPNRGGFFMDINAGKRAISLNLKHPRGKEILARLLKHAHAVGEGFSPGTMDRMGLGYDKLKEINPQLIYVQQSGMGQIGSYGQMRSYGPTAQAFSGISEMSGFPVPFPPAGIGYSFLDWFGAYNMANAILAGVYRQRATGKGCWIDSSQVEAGTYLNGTAILDFSANGRNWSRTGNRSPYRPAAPHGAFRVRGEDRWIAIACFTQEEWLALSRVLGNPAWASDSIFASLQDRIVNQDKLEALVNSVTINFEPYALMEALQGAGVAAGVCQSAEERCDVDPQLRSMNWLVELEQSEIGRWPSKEFPVHLSRTPAAIGGTIHRHGPSYAEDNEFIYGEWLGFSTQEIRALEEEDII